MKFGIIGFGKMGRIRYEAIREFPEHSVEKIFDPFTKNIPEGIAIARDYHEILEDKEIDGVFICLPNYLICKHVIESLDSKKHVFCEKPPGINSEETLKIIEAEKRNKGLKLMFGFNHRHHDSIIYAKKVVDSGRLGKVLWMRGRYGKSVDDDFCKTWRAKKATAGGGIFLDQGIHMLDLFLMMADDFDKVQADVSNLFWNLDIEDNVFAIFKNKRGQVASLHSTMTQWRHLFSFEIFLEKGHIVINGLLTSSGSYGEEQLSIAENSSKKPQVSWGEEEKATYNIDTSWRKEINIFSNSIKNNLEIPVGNSKDAYKLMRLVDMVYKEK